MTRSYLSCCVQKKKKTDTDTDTEPKMGRALSRAYTLYSRKYDANYTYFVIRVFVVLWIVEINNSTYALLCRNMINTLEVRSMISK